MIRAPLLAAWLALTPSHLVDRQGNHFANRQLSHEAADAMATACAEADPFPSDDDGRICGAFLVVMAGLESGFSLHPNGLNDHGRARGPYQEWTGGDVRSQSWLASTRHYLVTVRDAMRACPGAPISRLAGERCGGEVHRARWAQVVRIVQEVAFP